MHVFRFINPTYGTKMEQGRIVNGLKSKMWVERYDVAGEFKFVGKISRGIKEQLPIGSFISHTDTEEIMRVENHEIVHRKGQEPEIVISGRGFETFFENRIIGSNKTYPTSTGVSEYLLASNPIYTQAVLLIADHIQASYLLNDDDSIPYVVAMTDILSGGSSIEWSLRRSDLYSGLLELLKVGGLGVKVIRPGTWSPLGPTDVNLAVVIHSGVDRSSQVIFSSDTGEIESAEYLWSDKLKKNAAIVSGRWVEVYVTTAAVGLERRTMLVDAADIDNSFGEAPTGTDLDDVIAKMQQRGTAAIAARNDVALTKVEVSKKAKKARYRTDFNVGDVISVLGEYNDSSLARVSEYVEIEDESGSTRYPTLTVI